MKLTIPSHLSDDALVAELKSLAGRGRETTAQLVAHLAELDERRLYLRAGFPSLFMYCREVLLLSESEAYNRIEAARAARRFPLILDLLLEGTLNLTAVRLLAPHLTQANHQELLLSAVGQSKREVAELLARHFHQPDVASSVRKLPAPRPMSAPPAVAASAAPSESLAGQSLLGPATQAAPPPSPRPPVLAPLAPDRYQVRFTASAETCEMLRLAQDMLRHAVPTGDPAEIIKRALILLLEDLARRKFAATDRPRTSRGAAPGSRYVAAKVRRAVWIRDYGRCAYVAKSGHRCSSRSFVEFHHLDPYGVGGEATVERIELRCRAHNNYEAELFYGRPQPTRSGTSAPRPPMAAPGGPNPHSSRRTTTGSTPIA